MYSSPCEINTRGARLAATSTLAACEPACHASALCLDDASDEYSCYWFPVHRPPKQWTDLPNRPVPLRGVPGPASVLAPPLPACDTFPSLQFAP